MKKNLLDKDCIESMAARVQKLQAAAQPLWGSMNATEMLLHCNRVNEQLLTASPLKKGNRLRHYILRWLVLYLKPTYPKNAQTPKRNVTTGQVDASAFEEQRQRFIETLRRFPSHQNPIELPHPYFGDLNTRQWGLAGYKHVDHHLRQFGL